MMLFYQIILFFWLQFAPFPQVKDAVSGPSLREGNEGFYIAVRLSTPSYPDQPRSA